MASSSLLSPLSHADSHSEVSQDSSFSVGEKGNREIQLQLVSLCDNMLTELVQRLGSPKRSISLCLGFLKITSLHDEVKKKKNWGLNFYFNDQAEYSHFW